MKPTAAERVALERALYSINPFWVLVVALSVAALVMWFGLLPKAQGQWVSQNQEMQVLREQMALAPVALPLQAPVMAPGLEFQAVLGRVPQLESYVGVLLNLSQTLDIPAVTGEYKLSCDAATSLCRYRVRLPLVGSYLQIRTFVEQSLLALPFASLDELSLRRDGIASGELEAGLTFSMHLSYPEQGLHVAKEGAP
jgi:hypothetical protein